MLGYARLSLLALFIVFFSFGGTITTADLQVTKSDSPDPVIAGTNLTYTITVTNGGPDAAPSASLTDNIPVDTTFVSFNAPAGWTASTPPVGGTGTVTATNPSFGVGSAVFTLVVNVNPSAFFSFSISNTATVASAATDGSPLDNQVTEDTEVMASADLQVTKTDSPDPVVAGQNITYTLTLTNAGPSDAVSVFLDDNIPANTTFVSAIQTSGPAFTLVTPPAGGTGTFSAFPSAPFSFFAAGATATFDLVVNVGPSTPPAAVIVNTVSVAQEFLEPNPADNTDTETTALATTVDLVVAKTAGAGPFSAGGNADFTITVTNSGTGTATNVTVVDTLPAGATVVSSTPSQGTCSGTGPGPVTCTLGSILSGGTATVLLIMQTPATPGTITNNATATSTEADANAANNAAASVITTQQSAAIPTLSQWMLLLLALALAGLGVWKVSF